MKILLADDHALFRAGLLHVLCQLNDQVDVIEVGTCADALGAAAAHPDLSLALFDLQMPDGHGLAAIDNIRQHYPALPVVVLSGSEKREDMERAFDAGALGFIPKTVTPGVMLGALRLVLAGGTYIPPALLQPGAGNSVSEKNLTPRQLDVLARVVEGKPNKAIAREIGLTEATVKAHITAVFRVLKVSNRTQVARVVETLKIKLPPT